MSEKEYKIKLTPLMTQAMDHILRSAEIKQRGKAKIHSSLMKKVKKKCMNMMNDFQGSFIGGSFTIFQKELDYLEQEINRIYEGPKGLPGSISEGTVGVEEQLEDIKLQIFADKKAKKNSNKD